MRTLRLPVFFVGLALLVGCGGGGGTQPPSGTVIGPAGGQVTSPDGKVQLVVPQGALSSPVTISLNAATGTPPATGVVAAVDCQPDGLDFGLSCTLVIHYEPGDLPPGYDPNNLMVAVVVDGLWVMLPAVLDPVAQTLMAMVDHFSVYGMAVPRFRACLTPLDDLDSDGLLVVGVGNRANRQGARGRLEVYEVQPSGAALLLGFLDAEPGTRFCGVGLANGLAFTVAQILDESTNTGNALRVFDLSNPSAPALFEVGDLPLPDEGKPQNYIIPTLDVRPIPGTPGVRVLVGVALEGNQSGLYTFDVFPPLPALREKIGGGSTQQTIPPLTDITIPGHVHDVLLLDDLRVAVLVNEIAPLDLMTVRVLDPDLVMPPFPCSVPVPGGVAFARGVQSVPIPPPGLKIGGDGPTVTVGSTHIVLDPDSSALHVLSLDPLEPMLLQTVSGVPAPVAAYRTFDALYVASATDGVLKYDPLTYKPLPFEFPMGGAGSCHALVVHGVNLLGALLSPEGVSMGVGDCCD